MAERTPTDPAADESATEGSAYDDHGTDVAYSESGAATARTKGPKKSKRTQPHNKWKLLGVTAGGLVLALLLGWFTGVLAGKAFGPAEPKPKASATKSSDAKATGEGSTPGEAIKIANAALLDPPPGDGQENPDRINLSYDGQPGTTWPTLQYKGTATFGNIKPGVGIVYDLGADKTVSAVKISTTLPGATVEIHTGTALEGTLDQFPLVAGPTQLQAETNIPLPAGTTTRYVLVWITQLVEQQGFFQASLSEVNIIS